MKINVKKDDINTFNNSSEGKKTNYYLKRVKITGILCITFGLIWLILNIYYKTRWYEYVTSILLILFGIYFIFNSNRIKKKEVNKYIYNKKTSK